MTSVITYRGFNMSHTQHWQHHINAWQQTGGSQAHYCRAHELDKNQFSYWKCKLAKRNDVLLTRPSGFAVAQLATTSESASSLCITLPNGVVLGGIDAMNAAVAAQLLEYLRWCNRHCDLVPIYRVRILMHRDHLILSKPIT